MDVFVGALRGIGYSIMPMFVSLLGSTLWITSAMAGNCISDSTVYAHRILYIYHIQLPGHYIYSACAVLYIGEKTG